jgi:hypothetical protein
MAAIRAHRGLGGLEDRGQSLEGDQARGLAEQVDRQIAQEGQIADLMAQGNVFEQGVVEVLAEELLLAFGVGGEHHLGKPSPAQVLGHRVADRRGIVGEARPARCSETAKAQGLTKREREDAERQVPPGEKRRQL